MKLESNYIRTTTLGNYVHVDALGASTVCDQVRAGGNYRWTSDGKCLEISSGRIYSGNQSDSNCVCLGPPPAQGGKAGLLDFLTKTFVPSPSGAGIARGVPSSSFTSSGILVPAVAVVGGVALLLILTKKK